VRGQGMHESWVIGKTEATAALLKRHERVVVTKYKKFGLGLNQIIFMGMHNRYAEHRKLEGSNLVRDSCFLFTRFPISNTRAFYTQCLRPNERIRSQFLGKNVFNRWIMGCGNSNITWRISWPFFKKIV